MKLKKTNFHPDIRASVIMTAVFYFLSGTAAFAASNSIPDYFSLSPEQLLGANVMSASRRVEKVAEVPAAVYVITQEDIQRSGMTSIPELLRMVPGVDVARQNSNTWAISIRGFNNPTANKILVMVDGRTVYNPLFAGTFWEVQDMPLADIERIEVIRGPGGALWGANAVNGVINIITKNAADTQGTHIVGGGGNYEKVFGTARYGGKIGNDSWYRVYAKGNERGSFHSSGLSGGDDNRANDSWQSYHAGFRMDWNGHGGPDTVSIHGDAYHVDADDIDESFSFTAPFTSFIPESIQSIGENIVGVWTHKYESGANLRLQSYLEYTSRNEILFQDHRTIFDNEVQYTFQPMGRHEWIAGATYRLTSDNIGGSDEITFDPDSLTQNLFGVFAQDKITLAPDHWYLTLGGKLEHNDYTGFEIQPDARLEWLPDPSQTVWASVSRAVRTPSRIERDLDIDNLVVGPGVLFPGFPTEVELAHNKDFDSEDLIAYELGYRKQISPAVSVDGSVFANDYRRLGNDTLLTPFFVPAGADPAHFVLPIEYTNGMSGEIYGAELAASWKVNPRWKLTAGYSHLEMFLHSPTVFGFSQETDEDRSPQNQFSLRSYWDINDRWTLDTMAYWVDQLPADNVPAYLRVDVNLGWKFNKHLRFNLVGQNLFAPPHREFGPATSANVSEVPTSIFGKFTWDF
ncbi:MAG TPA: TonB-dependent receptor [Patescibacteria group bacterium]|nr:TonB-dependent receptor [Patescibacteria group bacterium]